MHNFSIANGVALFFIIIWSQWLKILIGTWIGLCQMRSGFQNWRFGTPFDICCSAEAHFVKHV